MTSTPRRATSTAGIARHRGFTLIELLVVVAVISVLAALAVVNFLEAQTRAKVSAAKANNSVVRTALELYAVDNNAYPGSGRSRVGDPFGILAEVQLEALTTPIAYISPAGAMRDPFGTVSAVPMPLSNLSPAQDLLLSDHPFPELGAPNPRRSLLYFHYPSLAIRAGDPGLQIAGACILSIGPDTVDSLGVYRPFSPQFLSQRFAPALIAHPLDTIYDPTNGTISPGDIMDFAGAAQRFAVP